MTTFFLLFWSRVSLFVCLFVFCCCFFCETKKVNRIFYRVKNLIFLSFLQLFSYFLLFLCFFSFLSQTTLFFFFKSFFKSIFNFLLLLIVDLCHTFSRPFMSIVRGVCGHIKASWDNHSKCLSFSSYSRLSTCWICNNWTENTWDLAELYSARISTMKRKLAKKKKVVQSDSDDNSFNDGITIPQGFTAGGKHHLGGNSTDAIGIHSVSNCHQSPDTRHQSALDTGQPGTGQPGTSHRAPVTRHPGTCHQAAITRHRAPDTSHQAPVNECWVPGTGHQSTRHQPTRHQSVSPGTSQPVNSHQAPVTTHQAPVIRQQTLGTEHRVANYGQRNSEQLLANEPQNSRNTQEYYYH